jgi:methyl coenzyme M reductase alpha subunit
MAKHIASEVVDTIRAVAYTLIFMGVFLGGGIGFTIYRLL